MYHFDISNYLSALMYYCEKYYIIGVVGFFLT